MKVIANSIPDLKIHIDLVPCFVFGAEQWPQGFKKYCSTCKVWCSFRKKDFVKGLLPSYFYKRMWFHSKEIHCQNVYNSVTVHDWLCIHENNFEGKKIIRISNSIEDFNKLFFYNS